MHVKLDEELVANCDEDPSSIKYAGIALLNVKIH